MHFYDEKSLNSYEVDQYELFIKICSDKGLEGEPPCNICQAACCKTPTEIFMTYLDEGKYEFEDGHIKINPETGHCMYLEDGQCTIYDNRPHFCRTFDCRVFDSMGLLNEKMIEQGKPVPRIAGNSSMEKREHLFVHLFICNYIVINLLAKPDANIYDLVQLVVTNYNRMVESVPLMKNAMDNFHSNLSQREQEVYHGLLKARRVHALSKKRLKGKKDGSE